MRTAILKVEGLREGLITAEDIYNKNNGMLVPKDFNLTPRSIELIIANDIDRIKVYLKDNEKSEHEIIEEDPDEIMFRNLQKTIEEYKSIRKEDISKMEEAYFDIAKGKPVKSKVIDVLARSISESFDARLAPYIGMLKSSDNYTLEHSMNVGTLAAVFTKWMNYDAEKSNALVQAGLLHDIGKAKISKEILNKPDILTSEEYEIIKQHATFGYKILQESNYTSHDIKNGVLMHHERIDGSGYPLKAKDFQIHEFGKIIAILDTYDAMTTDRVFKHQTFALKVLDELHKNSFDKLDYTFTTFFINKMLNYYFGCKVRLNTGEDAFIVNIDSHNITRPIVRIDGLIVNLADEHNIEIEEII